MFNVELHTRCGCTKRIAMSGPIRAEIAIPLVNIMLPWTSESQNLSDVKYEARRFTLWRAKEDDFGQRIYEYVES